MSENTNTEETYISLTKAYELLKEKTGAKITRPTLKTKLTQAGEKEEFKGIIIQTGTHAWMQINRIKFISWYEGIYGKEDQET